MKTAELCVRDWSFLAAKYSYQESRLVLAGIPLDLTSSFRPGSRQGPQAIRSVSEGLEEFSPYLNLDLADCHFYDQGDLLLPQGNLNVCLQRIEQLCRLLLQDEKLPVFLGGEHLITYPIIKAAFDFYPDLAVLHFDAHADLRDEYLGETYSHATVMRRKTSTSLGSDPGPGKSLLMGIILLIFIPFGSFRLFNHPSLHWSSVPFTSH